MPAAAPVRILRHILIARAFLQKGVLTRLLTTLRRCQLAPRRRVRPEHDSLEFVSVVAPNELELVAVLAFKRLDDLEVKAAAVFFD